MNSNKKIHVNSVKIRVLTMAFVKQWEVLACTFVNVPLNATKV